MDTKAANSKSLPAAEANSRPFARASMSVSATAGWQAQRSILRDSMIETLVQQNITDPDDWFSKVPTYLRQGTDPTEKRLHLERICAPVAMHEEELGRSRGTQNAAVDDSDGPARCRAKPGHLARLGRSIG